MNKWICDGEPKDGKIYSIQNPPGRHEPYENYGADCVMCRLPREAMTGGKAGISLGSGQMFVSSVLTLCALGGGGYVAYKIFGQQSCPTGQQKVNNICLNISTSTPAPVASATPAPIVSATPAPTPAPTTPHTLAEVTNVPSGTFRYGGSTSFAPLRSQAVVGQIEQFHPGFNLSYTEPPPAVKPGSGSGIKMLLDGQLSFSQSSRPLSDQEYQAATTRNFKLDQIPVAMDGITFYVNPKLSIPGLNTTQIKDIYTGKITNWSQVGGPNLPITPLSRDPESGGTPDFFKENVLGSADFAPSVKPYERDTTGSIRKVALNPGGIAYATGSEVCNQTLIKPLPIAKEGDQGFVAPCVGNQVNKAVFANNTYPLTRRLFIIVKRDGSPDEQAGQAYANLLLSDEGQRLVDQAGLVPLR